MRSISIEHTLKILALALLVIAGSIFAYPAFAADAIPGAKELADTGLATVRIVMIILAITIFIVSVLLIMAHKISFNQLILVGVCCVLLGAAEPIVRFLVSLGQST